MEVLLITKNPGGGIRTYFRYIFSDPVMTDISVSLITPGTDSSEFFSYHFRTNTFTHYQTGSSIRSLSAAITRVIRERKPVLIHSHGFTAGVLAAIPARFFRIPHILTPHDMLLPGQFKGIKGAARKWAIGRLLALANVINPVGHDASANLSATYPKLSSRTQIHPIRNGIHVDFFLDDKRRSLRTELGIDDETVLLGFFGRFMGPKGFPLLRDAIDALNQAGKGTRFEVVCFGWGGFIREEQAVLRERKLDQFFHFLPSTDDMNAALRGVDAAVMPSRWETCPLLPMEAFVSGTVVIASDCMGMKEVTCGTPALTFPSGNVDKLVERLEHFEIHMEQCKADADSFRNEAAKRFDASETAAAVRDLYNKVADLHAKT